MRLHTAAYEGDAQTLAARAPPALDVRDAIGATPLIYAISGGERDAFFALIRAGADLGAAADSGYTALMWAAAHPARTEYVALLLDAAAPGSRGESSGAASRKRWLECTGKQAWCPGICRNEARSGGSSTPRASRFP